MKKIIPALTFTIILLCLFVVFVSIPAEAEKRYGPPAGWLTASQRVQYSAELLWYSSVLATPLDTAGVKQPFTVEPGESVNSIAYKLETLGFIRSAASFRTYLIYTGLDMSIQSGNYQFSPAMSAIDIAQNLQDATSKDVTFTILPGWRMEEIAASLPTSGLDITPEEFLSAARRTDLGFDFLTGASNTEGFLSPGSYILLREIPADALVDTLVRNFALRLTREMSLGFEAQGLSTYQAVTLASIVEREAIRVEEAPYIASVYLNRLNIGMRLEADPTVQYAVGFNGLQNTWWTNPLGMADLQYDSPFNTYLYSGLPPTPISNPGIEALQAVANPEQTTFLFFRAKCDGSGYHTFSNTFEEHLENSCG